MEAETVAQGLAPSTIRKYRTLFTQLTTFCEKRGIAHFERIDLAAIRAFRQSWTDSNYSASKKLERLRTIYSFAIQSGHAKQNLAKELAKPKITEPPTMPFTKEQMISILFACETHQQSGQRRSQHDRRIRPLVLLLRYSGLRIGDALSLKKSALIGDRILLHTQKTGTAVHLKLPQVVVDALNSLPSKSEEYFFWTGKGRLETVAGNYRRNLREVFRLAGIPDGHPHRFRDTFAVELLLEGASIEDVSKLLGHQSIRITERHYAPWVKERQARLDAQIERSWRADPILEAEAKGTPEVHGRKERRQ
ncbi:MAG: tyrosine-type recombinase/integrase [Bryobacterales bacterium]|nr:tyrosine-type recombinase/integrase [Bryobacterales bacterium]